MDLHEFITHSATESQLDKLLSEYDHHNDIDLLIEGVLRVLQMDYAGPNTTDPNPLVIPFGAYRHPRTNNELLYGMNLKKIRSLPQQAKEQFKEALPEIMSSKLSPRERYSKAKDLLGIEFMKRTYRHWNQAYISNPRDTERKLPEPKAVTPPDPDELPERPEPEPDEPEPPTKPQEEPPEMPDEPEKAPRIPEPEAEKEPKMPVPEPEEPEAESEPEEKPEPEAKEEKPEPEEPEEPEKDDIVSRIKRDVKSAADKLKVKKIASQIVDKLKQAGKKIGGGIKGLVDKLRGREETDKEGPEDVEESFENKLERIVEQLDNTKDVQWRNPSEYIKCHQIDEFFDHKLENKGSYFDFSNGNKLILIYNIRTRESIIDISDNVAEVLGEADWRSKETVRVIFDGEQVISESDWPELRTIEEEIKTEFGFLLG